MCDACQRRKELEFVASLGDVEQPSGPFEFTSVDLTGPYMLTPRKNKYLLNFIYHFTKYVWLYQSATRVLKRVQGFTQSKSLPDTLHVQS